MRTISIFRGVLDTLENLNVLHRRGSNKYFCPFCEDPRTSKSPSFAASPEKGILKCFGDCGRTYKGLNGLKVFLEDLIALGKISPEQLPDIPELQDTAELDRLMAEFQNALWSSPFGKEALKFLGIRGVLVDEDVFLEFPVGVFDYRILNKPWVKEETKDTLLRLVNHSYNTLVFGYVNYKTGKIVGLKLVPFDITTGKTQKNLIRFYLPEGSKTTGIYFGIPGIFEEVSKIYVTEGELDALVTATRTGWRNVIALGGHTSKGGFVGYEDREWIVIPDSFGEKRGEEIALEYLSRLPDNTKIVNWWQAEEPVEEDPAEMFREDAEKYTRLVEKLAQDPLDFLKDYIVHKVSNPNDENEIRALVKAEVVNKIPPQLYIDLQREFPFLPTDWVRHTARGGIALEDEEAAAKILEKYFQPVHIEVDRDVIITLRYIPNNKTLKLNLTGEWNKALGNLSLVVGEHWKKFLASILPIEPTEKEQKNKERYYQRLSRVTKDAFLIIASEFQGKIRPDAKTLQVGVHWLPNEEAIVLVDVDKQLLITKNLKVERVKKPILFEGRYVIDTTETHPMLANWLPKDLDLSDIDKVNPTEVYNRTVDFLRKLIDFSGTGYEYQYSLLALLPFYGNVFDVFPIVPYIAFHGNSGSGKSTVAEALTTGKKGKYAGLILPGVFLANYTAAGIRQTIRSSRVTVAMDEAEPNVLEAVMDEIRTMTASADGAHVVRGTREQKASTYNMRFGVLLTMIYLPSRQQDVNRMLIFRFIRKTGVLSPLIRLEKAGWTWEKTQQLAFDLFKASLKIAFQLPNLKKKAEEYILHLAPGLAPREVELQSVLISIALALGIADKSEFVEAYKQFLLENQAVKDMPTQEDTLLHTILNHQIFVERKGQMALAEVCLQWHDDEELRRIMQQRGWRQVDGKIWIPLASLGSLVDKLGHANLAAYLKGSFVEIKTAYLVIDIERLQKFVGRFDHSTRKFGDVEV